MSGIARKELADAVTAAGIECAPYPPDSPSPPAAFVDTLEVDFSQGSGWSFCYSGLATATIVTCAQRHDKAAGTKTLEDLAPAIISNIEKLPGARVMGMQSGTVQITGNDLPSVLYQVQFALQMPTGDE